jgi:predicted metal-binding membrane protein
MFTRDASLPVGKNPAGGRSLGTALIAALALSAWLALALWSASPYRGYLDHGRWDDPGWLVELCRVVPAGGIALPALFHAAAWVLMILAMMLPTVLPLLRIFERLVGARPDAARLVASLLTGYLLAWFAFGLAMHGLDTLLRSLATQSPWLVSHAYVVGVAALAGAGAFQWSALKYHCLERCRTPLGFVMERWHGRAPAREALRLGIDHGLFCVGCCWALMLVMFVVGMGNLGVMLVLAAVMSAEKNLPWGVRLRTPVGVGLLGWAVALAVTQS